MNATLERSTATRSAWNITRYPGQKTWTLWRHTGNVERPTEWLLNDIGQVLRLRSEVAAVQVQREANAVGVAA